MAQPETDNNQNRYFSPWGMQSDEPKQKKFRVEADIEYNRLLLNANKVEMKDIRELLAKLGEIPNEDGGNGIRTFELSPTEDTEKLKERLQQLWRGRNRLEFDFPEPRPSNNDATTTQTEKSHGPASLDHNSPCLLYTSPSPRDRQKSRMPSSA